MFTVCIFNIRFKPLSDCAVTLVLLMDYPIYIDTTSMEVSILYFKGLPIYKMMYFLALKIIFILAVDSGSSLFANVHCLI